MTKVAVRPTLPRVRMLSPSQRFSLWSEFLTIRALCHQSGELRPRFGLHLYGHANAYVENHTHVCANMPADAQYPKNISSHKSNHDRTSSGANERARRLNQTKKHKLTKTPPRGKRGRT